LVLYHPEWALMGIIHGLVGVFWVGIHFNNEAFLLPSMAKAQKLADMPMLRMMPKISMVGAILGFSTLITGVIFFLIRFPLDPGGWLADPEARTVLVGLVMVLASLVIGMGILRPGAEAFGKKAGAMSPMDPLPDDMKAGLARIGMFLHISTALVVGALITMILAINGGI